jgi:hypothetical protein
MLKLTIQPSRDRLVRVITGVKGRARVLSGTRRPRPPASTLRTRRRRDSRSLRGRTTRHRVLREGDVLVDGTMRHVFVDPQALEKLPIPAWLRESLAPWVTGEGT